MRRTSRTRFLATILALSLTLVGASAAVQSASAYTVSKTSVRGGLSSGGATYGDPDSPGGSGYSGPNGTIITPRTSLKMTQSSATGDGASSKMGWWDVYRMLIAQWRVTFVR